MMHRCSSSQGNMVGPCSCGLFHHHHHHSQSNSSSFSMLFSKPFDHHQYHYEPADQTYHNHHQHMYSFPSPNSSSSSVDCTLSLGTPSTRLCSSVVDDDDAGQKRNRGHERRSDSCVSNFCWDLLQSNKHSSSSAQTTISHKNGGRGGNNHSGNNTTSNNDPLVARRCANCDTTSTPLWRNGPRGPKSLCNACGIRFKKEERRASAAAATSTANGAVMESSHVFSSHQYHHNNTWSNFPHSQTQKMPCLSPASEFRFMDDHDNHQYESDTGISFLSWRLNVTDRPSLVHDFTR